MQLSQLMQEECRGGGEHLQLREGTLDIDILGLSEDSRSISAGDLFIARPGARHDGQYWLAEAIHDGAVAVLTEEDVSLPEGISCRAHLVSGDVPLAIAKLAERYSRYPSRSLDVIGVTGTNGKTSVAFFVQQLLRGEGLRCGFIGTLGDGMSSHDHRAPAVAECLTTPGAIALSATLASMVAEGFDACVIEASSHGLVQQRMAGLQVAGAVFTNLSGDHLDYHDSMDSYALAKARLLASVPPTGWAIVHADSPYSDTMQQACRGKLFTSSLVDQTCSMHARVLDSSMKWTDVEFSGPWGEFDVRLPFPGEYNIANALQATGVAWMLEIERDRMQALLGGMALPPGRLERISDPAGSIAVFVDYAHTDGALESMLRALSPLIQDQGRLWVVFGCGGDRDRTKRGRMAKVACRHADRIIITSDNPRTEDPGAILKDIFAGVGEEDRSRTTLCQDRRAAIELAIGGATGGDVVVIAGKGHEGYQLIGTESRDFDDREVASRALRRRGIQE